MKNGRRDAASTVHHPRQHKVHHPQDNVLMSCRGAEKYLQTCARELKCSLWNLWHKVSDPHMPLPGITLQEAGGAKKKDVGVAVPEPLRKELIAKMERHMDEYVRAKTSGLIPSSDDRFTGSCFSETCKGTAAVGKGKMVQFRSFCIFEHDAKTGAKRAFAIVHTHVEGDSKATEDDFLLHHFDGSTHFFVDGVKSVPNAILVSGTGSCSFAYYKRDPAKGDVMDHVSSPAIISMLFYRGMKGEGTGATQFMPLQSSRANSLVWVYAIKTSDGTTDLLICRKRDFRQHRNILAERAMEHAGVVETPEERKVRLQRGNPDNVGMTTTFPGDKNSDGYMNRVAISAANIDASKHVGPLWFEYEKARKIYAGKQLGLVDNHSMLLQERAAQFVRHEELKGKNCSHEEEKEFHHYDVEREITPLKGMAGVRLHWTYHVRTKTMPRDEFAIEFHTEDDYSGEIQGDFAFTVAEYTLHHCLAHRMHDMKGRHARKQDMWSVAAIHHAIDVVERDRTGKKQDGAVVFEGGDHECTVTVRRRAIDVDRYTCSSGKDLHDEQQLQREEKTALAVRSICSDRPYEVSVNFGSPGSSLHANGFSVVVHLAMAQMPFCREDAAMEFRDNGNSANGTKEKVGGKTFVRVKSLAHQKHHLGRSREHGHHGIGMQQVLGRVAELQAAYLGKRMAGGNIGQASVKWCNANVAHVHQVKNASCCVRLPLCVRGSRCKVYVHLHHLFFFFWCSQGNRYVWAKVTAAWSVPLKTGDFKQVSLETRYSLTVASIGHSHKKGSKAMEQATALRKEHAENPDVHVLNRHSTSVKGTFMKELPEREDHRDAVKTTPEASVGRFRRAGDMVTGKKGSGGPDFSKPADFSKTPMEVGAPLDFSSLRLDDAIGAVTRVFN